MQAKAKDVNTKLVPVTDWVLWHCYLFGTERHSTFKQAWGLVCWWWRSDWSFACLRLQWPPLQTANHLLMQQNPDQSDILVSAYTHMGQLQL